MTEFTPANVLAKAERGIARLEAGRIHNKVRAVVRAAEVKRTKDGKPYLNVTLADKSGEKEAKSWDGAKLAATLPPGTVVEFARIEADDWGLKFDPKDLALVPVGGFEPREFVPSLEASHIESNWRELHDRLDTVENVHLIKLREAIFGREDLASAYKNHPSAVHHHHNYLGGNVQHVVGIMRVVDAVAQSYRDIDRDVVVFGAAIHDLGKLREYAVDTIIRVTDEGRLRGHLVIGAEWLGQICAQVRHDGYDFPAGLEQHLVHIILSHHRKGEWGSPKPPATPEAMLVHLGDYADSQTKGFLQAMDENRDAADGWAQRWDSDAGAKQWMKTRREWD